MMKIATAQTTKMIVLRALSWAASGTQGAGDGAIGGRRGEPVVRGGEAYQRAPDIVNQTRQGRLGRAAAGDQHIVAAGAAQLRQKRAGGLAQAAFGAVAHHGAADLLGCSEAHADQGPLVAAGPHLDDHAALGLGRSARGEKEVWTAAEPLDHRWTQAVSFLRPCARRRWTILRPFLVLMRSR
jgi:hypothetical protein